MTNMSIKIKIGRKYGNTIHEKGGASYFLFHEDPKIIPYGEQQILAIRQTKETINDSQSHLRVLGVLSNDEFLVSKNEVIVPVSKKINISGFDLRVDIERLVRGAYRTEEQVVYLWDIKTSPSQ